MVDPDVELARGGNVAAFERLATHRVQTLLRLAGAIVLDPDVAEDVVQDSLVNAWRHIGGLKSAETFDGWLRRIVVNTARNAVRSRRRVRALNVMGAPDPIRSDSAVDDRLAIEEAMAALDADHRVVVALHYLDGHPVDAIAGLLGIPVGTVKSRLHTARGRLRDSIEERDG